MRQRPLTEGNSTKNLLIFAFPMMAGNLLQQCYNIADTLIVSRFLGANAHTSKDNRNAITGEIVY